jgi:hypothetical protein
MPFGPTGWSRRADLPDFRVSLGGSALPIQGAMSIDDDAYFPYRTTLITASPDDGMVYIGGGMVRRTPAGDEFTYPGGSNPITGEDGGLAITGLRRDGPFALANIEGVPFALIGGHSVAFVSVNGKSGPGHVKIAVNWDPDSEDPFLNGWQEVAHLFTVPAKDFGTPGGAGFMSLSGGFFKIDSTYYCMFGLEQGTSGPLGSSTTRHAAIWKTEDFGETWSQLIDLSAISPWGGSSLPTQVIGVNRSGLLRIIAVLGSTSVWYSDDLGESWTEAGGNNINAQKLMLLSSGGVLLGKSGGLGTSTGSSVSCDLGENFSASVQEPTGNNNTRLGVATIGLEEAVAAVPGGTGVRLFWSNNGGEDFIFQGEFEDMSNLSPLMDMFLMGDSTRAVAYNQGREVIKSNEPPTGTVSPRSICPGIAAGLANAGKLVTCGLPVMTNNCP